MAGVLAFILIIILPAQRLATELDGDIEGLRVRIEEQKVLFPLFKSLLEKSKPTPTKNLTPSKRTRLGRNEIAEVPKRLQEMATVHHLNVRDVVPEVNTLADTSNRFMVKLAATGQFSDLRGFLIELGSLSYFESLEELEVRAAEGGEEFGLKIWMARE
jgi:hypothetical protein